MDGTTPPASNTFLPRLPFAGATPPTDMALGTNSAARTTSIPGVDARREIVYGLTDEEVRLCLLQVFDDNDEHQRTDYPQYVGPIPGTIENVLRPVVLKLAEGPEGRELLLRELDKRDEHMRANHSPTEEASDPLHAYIQRVVERVRQRG